MYSFTKKEQKSRTLTPPDFKPALLSIEKILSETITNWCNETQQLSNDQLAVYNHVIKNPLFTHLSIKITDLESELDKAKITIDKLKNENELFKQHINSNDTKNVTLDICEIPNTSSNTINEDDINLNVELHNVVQKLALQNNSRSFLNYNVVSAVNSDDEELTQSDLESAAFNENDNEEEEEEEDEEEDEDEEEEEE